MATTFTKAVTGENLPAETINQLIDALEGVVGKGHYLGASQVDDPDHYALDVQQHDTIQGLVARLRDSTGVVLLAITKDGLTIGGNVIVAADKTIDGVDVGAHTHSAAAGHGVKIPSGSLANNALSADVAGRAQMQDGFLTLAKLGYKGAYTVGQADHIRIEVKEVTITLYGDTDNRAASATWTTPFATAIGAWVSAVIDKTTDMMANVQWYFTEVTATGFTVRAALRGTNIAGTYTLMVLGIGIGTA
jgi:hypothetical protein